MNMLAKYSFATLCATAVVAVPLAFAQKPPPPPTYIHGTTLVYDQDTSVPANQYLFRSDLVGGLNQTTYTNTGNVTIGIDLGSPYGWGMDLFNQTLRRVWITLKSVDGSTPPAPSGLYSEKVDFTRGPLPTATIPQMAYPRRRCERLQTPNERAWFRARRPVCREEDR